jgi:uncharacterized protein (TIGR02284 family)
MSNTDIEVLNDVTKTLIDSQKGYEKAADITTEHTALRSQFQERAGTRQQLINEAQLRVRALGGEPQQDGGSMGSLHRAMTDFSAMFQSDKKAALEAIDDGEEHLAEQVGDKLEKDDLSADTRALLIKVRASAVEGERFAERLEEVID